MKDKNKKEHQFSKVDELEDSLSSEEKDKYDRNTLLTIDVIRISSFAVGLFFGTFGLLLYLFYNFWMKYFQIDYLPTKLREWYTNHSPLIYCIIGCLINLFTKMYLVYQASSMSTSNSIWG